MVNLVWDKIGDRTFESGLDRGVLYLPDGSAVVWNGLTSIIEGFNRESAPVYFDGNKVNDFITLGEFSATLKAITYPEEFVELEGLAKAKEGLFYTDQMAPSFGLSYRTRVSNDVEEDAGYKIHILYNVTAIPKDKNYASLTDDPSLMELEWEIMAVPEEVPGYRPTSHIIIETEKIDPWLLEEIEGILYGSEDAVAGLIPMNELTEFIKTWFRIKIYNNGDGTWTAISRREGLIFFGPSDYFEIYYANAIWLDDVTFVISDTEEISQVPLIKIIDHGDGTWTATTDQEELIVVDPLDDTVVTINSATIEVLNTNMYVISDTVEEEG